MMRGIVFYTLMAFCSGTALALDPLCTNTSNAAIPLCPSGSVDWYASYTAIVNDLDALERTAPSTFTVAGNAFSVGPSSGSLNCSQGRCGIGIPTPSNSHLAVIAGNTNVPVAPENVYYSTQGSTQTIADTNEKVLYSTATAGGLLANNGDCILISCGVAGAATATTKRVRIRFGGTTLSSLDGVVVADSGAQTANGVLGFAKAKVCKSNSNAQNVDETLAMFAGLTTSLATPALTKTDTSQIIVSCTCQNGTANNGDCLGKSFTIVHQPIP